MMQPAILGTARVNNFRLGYVPAALVLHRTTRVRVLIAGVDAHVRDDGGSIQDNVNDAPNTVQLTVEQTAPVVGQPLRITINSDAPRLLFNGTLQTVALTYELLKTQWVWKVTAIDDMARLTRLLPFGTWTNVSATTVVLELIALFAPGFTGTHVQPGLPLVSVVFDGSEGWNGCLRQVATLIGGYYYAEDLDVHLFQNEVTDPPDPLDAGHGRFLDDPPITLTTDVSQVRTRVYGKGDGGTVPAAVLAGDTILPVSDATVFGAGGGRALVGTQRVAYTGLVPGGAATLVGPGLTPAVAPGAALSAGTGVEAGPHDYAYTWVTASGETRPSPLQPLTVGSPAAPTVAPTASHVSAFVTAGHAVGDSLVYAYSYSTALLKDDLTQDTALSPSSAALIAVAASPPVVGFAAAPSVFIQTSADPRVRWVHVWKRVNGGAWRIVVGNHPAYPAKGVANGNAFVNDIDVDVDAPATAVLNRVALTGVAVGPGGTTARKVYRTVASGAQLKLLQTLADNTTTALTDSAADGTLGANAPVTDTSALSQPDGLVLAGSATLILAGTGGFPTSGWVNADGTLVRYTGITGNTLTGIPPVGPGAITASLPYNERVLALPALTGVSGLTVAVAVGAPAHIWVQRDNLAARAVMAAIDGGDGIYEYLVVDEGRGEGALIALCDANLALFGLPLLTLTYATRDVRTKSGKPITVTLASPPMSATLTIQSASITELNLAPGVAPRFSVTASSVRFSLEDLLRRMTLLT